MSTNIKDYTIICHPPNSNEWKKVSEYCLERRTYIICLNKLKDYKNYLKKKLPEYKNNIYSVNEITLLIKTEDKILNKMSRSNIILMNCDLNIDSGETIDTFFKLLKEYKNYSYKVIGFSSVPFEYIKAGFTCKNIFDKKNKQKKYYSLNDHYNNIEQSIDVMDYIKLQKLLEEHNLKKGYAIIYSSKKELIDLKYNIEKIVNKYNYKIKVYINKINKTKFSKDTNYLNIHICQKCNIYDLPTKNIIFLLDKPKQSHINRTLNSLAYLCCGKKNNIILYTCLKNIEKYIKWNESNIFNKKYITGAWSSNLDKNGNIKSTYFN